MRRFPPSASGMVLPTLVRRTTPRHSEPSSGRSTLQRSASSALRVDSPRSIIECSMRKSRRVRRRLRSVPLIRCLPSSVPSRSNIAHSRPACSMVYPSLRPLMARSSNVLLFSAAHSILSRSISAFRPLPRGWGWGLRPATTWSS